MFHCIYVYLLYPIWASLVQATVRQLKKRLLQIGPPPGGWLTQTPGSTDQRSQRCRGYIMIPSGKLP